MDLRILRVSSTRLFASLRVGMTMETRGTIRTGRADVFRVRAIAGGSPGEGWVVSACVIGV